jgi:phosphoribosyl 1,2-cyclic phosphodiesterase
MSLRARFWGVRGSIPTPQLENLKFGGNTACVEISTAEERVVFDAGSGIRSLSQCMMKEANGSSIETRIFLTHFHWDHIQGIPFFAPIYMPKNHISFFSGTTGPPLEETLEGQMAKPYFPIDFSQVAARRDFCQISPGTSIRTSDLTISPFALNHPQGASGYRIEAGGAVIVYATDYEHGDAKLDKVLRDHAANADLLICDAQYTPEEYETHRGWGHSTWVNAVAVAKDARAKQLVLFHHDPIHDDDFMANIVKQAREAFPNLEAAYEGLTAEF